MGKRSRRWRDQTRPRRGIFSFEVDGPRTGRDTPILWPPRLPSWWGETERREAAGYVPNRRGPFFFCTREEFRLELFSTQQGKCHWCGDQMSMERRRITLTGRLKDNLSFATFEHIKPRSMGGGFNRSNIVLAHGACNLKRHKRKFQNDPYAEVLNAHIQRLGRVPGKDWHEKQAAEAEEPPGRPCGGTGISWPSTPSEPSDASGRGGTAPNPP